jgi:arylsulfatase A-like enzyme
MKNRNSFILICYFLSFFGSALNSQVSINYTSRKPNIVLIFSDDVGWTGLSSFGSRYYETPNIDKLASGGMKFTQGYACASVCAPSRTAMLSGMYAPGNGTYRVTNVPEKYGNLNDYPAIQPRNKPFSESIVTIAEALKENGYTTGMFGKWHVSPGDPGQHGFDSWIMSQGKHFDFKTSPGYDVDSSVYLSDFMTDKAIEFIHKNKENPFFLYIPEFLVHKPHEAKDSLIQKYAKKETYGYHANPVYAAMTESMDYSVGRICKILEELNLLENTLIVFTSDNGGRCAFNANLEPKSNSFTDNLPLRDGKGSYYEGGIRVPYIFYWKGKVMPGTTCEQQIIGIDLYPTFLEITNSTTPNQQLDGISLVPCLVNNNNRLPQRPIFWHYPNYGKAIRNSSGIVYSNIPTDAILYGDYKLLEFYHDSTDHLELYNIKEDLSERKNLIHDFPEKADELHQMLISWRKEYNAEWPVTNPDFNK